MRITNAERRGVILLALILALILGPMAALERCSSSATHAPLPLPEAQAPADSIPADTLRHSPAGPPSGKRSQKNPTPRKTAKKTPLPPRTSPLENPTPAAR